MSLVYILSDLHLGHANICNFRTQFSTVEEHDQTIIENYQTVVTKRDTVIFLGDVAFTKEALETVKGLQGNKILGAGNHDTERGIDMKYLTNCGAYSKVYSMWSRKGCWLTHCPVHPDELRGKFNIHGHVHGNTLDDPRYFNASMENIDYKPKRFIDILEELREGV